MSSTATCGPIATPHYRNGLSLLLIDNDTPGVECRKLNMLGRRSIGTYEVFFNDVEVPAERLVGGENNGWNCLMGGLQTERAVSSAGNCGGAQAVCDIATAYAQERVQFGQPIGSFQSIAHMIADMQTEVDAATLLMWRAVWLVASGHDALREITMAKLFSSETYVKVANMGVQIMGGYGLNEEFDMQRHFRDARSATIAAGHVANAAQSHRRADGVEAKTVAHRAKKWIRFFANNDALNSRIDQRTRAGADFHAGGLCAGMILPPAAREADAITVALAPAAHGQGVAVFDGTSAMFHRPASAAPCRPSSTPASSRAWIFPAR